jgi:sporulation protein YlmC with PRC-barrel domain
MADHDYDLDTILDWRGRTVVDRKGEKLGRVGDLYLDEATDRPAYLGVRTGLLGRHESIVPLEGVEERDGDLVVPHDAELVRDAPSLDPDDGALDDAEQERLGRHYGAARAAGGGAEATGDAPRTPTGDAPEMIRSEEEVVTGTTAPKPTERVRIRKVVVTDHVKRTVPVRREEVRLETEPPPEGEIESVQDAGEAPGAR